MSRTVEMATVEIGIQERWDALALSKCLIPYHSYHVRCEPERWVVDAQTPGCHGERITNALSAIEEWLVGRHFEDASVRVDGRPTPLPRQHEDRLSAASSRRGSHRQRRSRQGSQLPAGQYGRVTGQNLLASPAAETRRG